jgi:hypothetical protein
MDVARPATVTPGKLEVAPPEAHTSRSSYHCSPPSPASVAMTYQIVYSSQATGPMTATELEQILVDARAGNEARNVTGALVFVEGVFLQILEGNEEVVRALMANIARDARHNSVTVFHEAEVAAPTFGTWRMAYVSATPEEMSAWAGLPGTATIDALLQDIGRDPQRVPQILGNILGQLAA